MILRSLIALSLMSCAVTAQDILILGEVHDNPAHHAVQAREVGSLAPAAIVFEMLTPEQADGQVLTKASDLAATEAELGWADSGWPDFAMYHPIFAAAPEARIYGAGVPRELASAVLEKGLPESFASYGLDQPLDETEQAAREALQMAVHCDALPVEMLPGMVSIQRLRDATLAQVALRALNDTVGPVAVITGNGHARPDWGVPAYLKRVSPELVVSVIGQTEDGSALDGGFDTVLSAPAPDRPDPCEAFK